MIERRLRRRAKVTVSGGCIVRHFESLVDPRHPRNRRHLLAEVVTISVCGVIVGCDGPTAIRMWAKTKEKWLKRFLQLPNGVPSRDCIRRVLTALKPESFRECFQSWIASLMSDGVTGPPMVAIDGKSLRRSHDARNGLGPLHLVSAWATRHGLSLGQVATEEKSNEIRDCSINTEYFSSSEAGLADNSWEGDSGRMSPWPDQEGTFPMRPRALFAWRTCPRPKSASVVGTTDIERVRSAGAARIASARLFAGFTTWATRSPAGLGRFRSPTPSTVAWDAALTSMPTWRIWPRRRATTRTG